jgi:hypothetical protein
MIAVFAVLAAIALASGWRGEHFARFLVGMRTKTLTFAAILVVFTVSAASSLHIEFGAIDALVAFVFDTLIIAALALAFYGMGLIGNAIRRPGATT